MNKPDLINTIIASRLEYIRDTIVREEMKHIDLGDYTEIEYSLNEELEIMYEIENTLYDLLAHAVEDWDDYVKEYAEK